MFGNIGNGNSFQNGNFLNKFYNGNLASRLANMRVRGQGGSEAEETGEEEPKKAKTLADIVELSGKKLAKKAEAGEAAQTEEGSEEQAATGGVKSILDQFKDEMNKNLLSSLGLDDISKMPAGTKIGAMGVSAQFEVNYQAMMAVMGADGSMTMQSVNFSMSASFEYMGISAGMGSNFNPFSQFLNGGVNGTKEGEQTNANDPFAALRDLFSPEKTAQRILDFSLGFFGNSSMFREGGDTEESRGSFADYIGKAIQKGFDEALGVLGKLPEQTSKEIDKTHELVFDGLDNFKKNGYDSSKSGLYSSIQAYQSTVAMNYSSTSISYSAEEVSQMFGRNNPYQQALQAPAQEAQAAAASEEHEAVDVTA